MLVSIIIFLLSCHDISLLVNGLALGAAVAPNKNQKLPLSYLYFAYGSNMCSEVMTSLRKVKPISARPAMLENYRLKFDIPGAPFIEPSWASVEKCDNDGGGNNQQQQVHGVLYELTEEDFTLVCQTEGVPFAYILQACQVRPYPISSNKETMKDTEGAFTLVTSPLLPRRRNAAAPSQSYLNVLIRGAEEFGLEEDYIQKLKIIPAGRTLFGNGTAENMLRMARSNQEQMI